MWGNNTNRRCMCHTATIPCFCTNPMTSWSDTIQLNSNNCLLNCQRACEHNIYGFSHANNLVNPLVYVENDHVATEQMAANEVDSWLLSNPDKYQIDGSLNILGSYGAYGGDQCQGQFMQMQTQGIQTSSLPMDATIGTMDLPQESVGIYSNSTNDISSIGTQQLVSLDDSQKRSEFPQMCRQDRLQRYFEKKKTRKYEKKIRCSSRKTYAQTRPRIRGRFARSSQTDANEKQLFDQNGQ